MAEWMLPSCVMMHRRCCITMHRNYFVSGFLYDTVLVTREDLPRVPQEPYHAGQGSPEGPQGIQSRLVWLVWSFQQTTSRDRRHVHSTIWSNLRNSSWSDNKPSQVCNRRLWNKLLLIALPCQKSFRSFHQMGGGQTIAAPEVSLLSRWVPSRVWNHGLTLILMTSLMFCISYHEHTIWFLWE